MIPETVQDALNDQINAEIDSAYLYLSMAAYFESLNLPGFANWMKVQAQEEMTHAMKFYDFINSRGGRVALKPIAGPPSEWASPLAAFEAAYEHECHVTTLINKRVDVAAGESDHASGILLQWFVTEQVEEEANTDAVVQQLKLVGDNGQALLMIDRELAQRVFVPPPTGGEPA